MHGRVCMKCKREKVEDVGPLLKNKYKQLKWLSTYIECCLKNCSTWGSSRLMEEGSYCTTTYNYI